MPAETVSEFSLIADGGPLVWPLFLLSLIGFVLVVERTLFLHKGQIRAREFLDGIKNNLRQRRLVEALTVCEEAPGPVPRIVKAVLLHSRESEARMRAAAEEAALLELPLLERRIGTIGAIAKLAPLLGLIGTVIALLRAFLEMHGQGRYASADVFAGDVAGALSTTALGLIIAALAHLGHHFLLGRVRAIVHDIEETAHAAIRFLCCELPDESRPKDNIVTETTEEK